MDYLISQKIIQRKKETRKGYYQKYGQYIFISSYRQRYNDLERRNVIRRESAKVIAKVGHSLAGAICILGCNLRKLKGG